MVHIHNLFPKVNILRVQREDEIQHPNKSRRNYGLEINSAELSGMKLILPSRRYRWMEKNYFVFREKTNA